MSKTTTFTLYDAIQQWLTFKLSHATKMRDGALHNFNTCPSAHFLAQLRYCKHMVRTTLWLKTQCPKRFRDVVIYNQIDQWATDEFITNLIEGK